MKKILFVCSVDWYMITHRKQLILSCIKRGYIVHLICKFTDNRNYFDSIGVITHSINISRTSSSFFYIFKEIYSLFSLVKFIKPDILHLVALKCSLYGGLISLILKPKLTICAIAGFGYVFTHNNFLNFLRRFLINLSFRIIKFNKRCIFLCQNPSDLGYLKDHSCIKDVNGYIIKGSGVDLSIFTPINKNNEIFRIIFVGRLLWSKGLLELFNAIILLNKDLDISEKFTVDIFGELDLENPASLTLDDFQFWKEKNIVNFYPFTTLIHKEIAKSDVLVLPSYREGFPKVIIEAAACGVPVITTNVPGCRDAVVNGITGFIVEPRNHYEIARYLKALMADKSLGKTIGLNARKHALNNFGIESTINAHFYLYEKFHIN